MGAYLGADERRREREREEADGVEPKGAQFMRGVQRRVDSGETCLVITTDGAIARVGCGAGINASRGKRASLTLDA